MLDLRQPFTPIEKARLAFVVSSRIKQLILDGQSISRTVLTSLMKVSFGVDDSGGSWQMREAYDACEVALTQTILAQEIALDLQSIESATRMADLLPTHRYRTEKQIDLQQFSTPPAIASLAALAAQPNSSDRFLEPSAGTGLLAAFPSKLISKIHLNEIDPYRAELLALLFPSARITHIDAARIHQIATAPTLAILNPPYSRSAGGYLDRLAFARHLLSTIKALQPGGRAVAILPQWFQNSGKYADAYTAINAIGHISANILLPEATFAKHGTGIGARLVVVDKAVGQSVEPSQAQSIEHAFAMVSDVPARAALTTMTPVRSITPPSSLSSILSTNRSIKRPPQHPASTTPMPASPLSYTPLLEPLPAGESEGVYIPHRASRIKLDTPRPHPDNLVESAAMGSVPPPLPSYIPLLTATAQNALSEAQLETLIYAGQSFELHLPGLYQPVGSTGLLEENNNGASYRRGFFLGDGTGAGKGRQVAGIIMDQWLRGRRRSIWISKSAALLEDAQRDWQALGGLATDIRPIDKWEISSAIAMDAGILFLTYSTLRSERPGKGSRLDQILNWLKPNGANDTDFQGVIAFDEAHAMANAAPQMSARGVTSGSDQGIAGLKLQNSLPSARVLYVSATGATDVTNLSYCARLGLWGVGTSFSTRASFIETIRDSGISAMEIVARDLKVQGLYLARALSFSGVEYEIMEHQLTQEQITIYDTYAEAWQIIARNLDSALSASGVTDELTGQTRNSSAKSAALSRFESTKQRFFSQILLTMKLPTMIEDIERNLAQGLSAVVQLVSTAESMLDRRIASHTAEEIAQGDIDLSPREHVFDYLKNAFPIYAMEAYEDDAGNIRSRQLYDDSGQPIICQQALQIRDNLYEQLGSLPGVSTALDEIINHFGHERVAEITGRSKRLIKDRNGVVKIARRSAGANIAETSAFMSDEKPILVYSEAGGTGRSYHADRNAKNQRRRVHYTPEWGWKAPEAVQGLGRTHRTNQVVPPFFKPVTTNVRGEKRFISSIARRLDSMGALTRGQRQTGGQNLFNPADNLESPIASEALANWYDLLISKKLTSVNHDQFKRLSGLNLLNEDGSVKEQLPPIQRWLNRLLAFPIHLQNAVFDEYIALIEHRIETLTAAGKLDTGIEDHVCLTARTTNETLLRTDPLSGAETKLLTIETESLVPVTTYEQATFYMKHNKAKAVYNTRSKGVAIVMRAPDVMTLTGDIKRRIRIVRPGSTQTVDRATYDESNWDACDSPQHSLIWNQSVEELSAKTVLTTLYMVTGLLLPVWSSIPGDFARIRRIVAKNGSTWLGRQVHANQLASLCEKFAVETNITLNAAELLSSETKVGSFIQIPRSMLSVRYAMVNSTKRIELSGWSHDMLPNLKSLGAFTEIINFKTRLFLPSISCLEQIMDRYCKNSRAA